MTQALLNTLTNIASSVYSSNNIQDTSSSDADFDQILDLNIIDECAETIVDADAATGVTTDECVAENLMSLISDSKLVAAIEMAVDAVTEDATNLISDAVDTDIVETNAEMNAETKDEDENENTGDVLDSNDNLITEENSDEDNTTTITQNEDPTMYKQLQTTLENPTALYVLTSQTNLNTQNNSQENENLLPADQAIKYAEKAETTTTEKFTLIEPTKSQPKENVSNQKTLRDIVDEKVLKELNVEAVSSSEEGGEAAGNLMQYQTPQEQAVKVMLHNDIKFEDMKTVSAQNQTKLQEAAAGRILEQVSKQMEGMCNSSKVNIVLNPASLGKVVLQLVNSKEGLIAHFTVNNADTQNALMKGLAGLKESLLAQGINVDNVVIKLSESDLQDGEQEQSWTQKDDSSGGNKGQGTRKQKQEKKNFEQMMFEMDQD